MLTVFSHMNAVGNVTVNSFPRDHRGAQAFVSVQINSDEWDIKLIINSAEEAAKLRVALEQAEIEIAELLNPSKPELLDIASEGPAE